MKTIGNETRLDWQGPYGVRCVAVRERGWWRLEQGPPRLVGRLWRHARDLRAAVKSARIPAVRLGQGEYARDWPKGGGS